MISKKSAISLQKEIREIYTKQVELFKHDAFMGGVVGINIETQNDITTIQILTENGSSTHWIIKYTEIELNQLERYLFNEIPLFKNGELIKEMEIL